TDGNTGTSTEQSFTTLPAPSVSEVVVSGVTNNNAQLNFTSSNASNVMVLYGVGDSYGISKVINTASRTSSYNVSLDNLIDGRRYNYRLVSFDEDGNRYESNVYSFITPPRPLATNIRFQPVADAPKSTLKVTWDTNVPSDSRISFGVSGSVKRSEQLSAELTTQHSMMMQDLEDDRIYEVLVGGVDGFSNNVVAEVQRFKTALDTRPPKISDVAIESSVRGSGRQAKGQIIVSWRTDEPATSQVAYGQGRDGQLSNVTSEDSRLTTEHTVIVSDIATASIYRVQPVSYDKARNNKVDDAQTVIIGRGSESVFGIIYSALQKIFGVKE
ncbi:hypothetical protein KDA11_02710, partial [Candidatus Saccharibacteria bacterium]|nr:hypothetical protein [Candidatus Saccharibacteria bacterium]